MFHCAHPNVLSFVFVNFSSKKFVKGPYDSGIIEEYLTNSIRIPKPSALSGNNSFKFLKQTPFVNGIKANSYYLEVFMLQIWMEALVGVKRYKCVVKILTQSVGYFVNAVFSKEDYMAYVRYAVRICQSHCYFRILEINRSN